MPNTKHKHCQHCNRLGFWLSMMQNTHWKRICQEIILYSLWWPHELHTLKCMQKTHYALLSVASLMIVVRRLIHYSLCSHQQREYCSMRSHLVLVYSCEDNRRMLQLCRFASHAAGKVASSVYIQNHHCGGKRVPLLKGMWVLTSTNSSQAALHKARFCWTSRFI